MAHIEEDIKAAEKEMDDDAESIITNERYIYIASIIKACYKKKNAGKLSSSDKIDKVVTNRWLGLPIFAAVMFFVYYVSMVTIGSAATDWANDGLFGDGWHLFGIGSSSYEEADGEYSDALNAIERLSDVKLIPRQRILHADTALCGNHGIPIRIPRVLPATDSRPRMRKPLRTTEMTVYYSAVPKDKVGG